MIPPAVVARLGGLYPQSAQTHEVLDPAQFGLSKVGHLAAFARRNGALWPAILGDANGGLKSARRAVSWGSGDWPCSHVCVLQ